MADADRPPVKRSRFDQTEPEPKRASRFDRRSRSPPSHRNEARDRSPLKDNASEARKSPSDAAAAAAAAAARITAQMQARHAPQHVDVPPIKSATPTGTGARDSPSNDGKAEPLKADMYVADGDYIQDIEVNDLRNRYLITKGSTQKMIKEETGADVTTRGNYYPNKAMATAANPPLYLHITSTSKAGLEAAVAKINEMINQELPQLVDERRFRRREEREPVERDELGRRKWPEEKIPIDLEPVQGFNLRAQVVGHGGSYVKHIQQETRCRVQIKGRGSGYLEAATNQESDEDMYLHVTGPDADMVIKAKELCQDLIDNVKEQYEEFKARPPRFNDNRGYGDHRGGHRGHDSQGGYGGQRDHYSSYGRYGSEGASKSPSAPASNTANQDHAAQYAQYYGGQDPYAAYGGYANYVALYQQYYGQQGQAQGAAPAAPGQSASPPPPPAEAAPPPPPPSAAAPPPPPSGSPPGAPGSYGAVPPPPGL